MPRQIHRILTAIHSLPYDPEAEREREELTDSIEAHAHAQASRAALRADAAHYPMSSSFPGDAPSCGRAGERESWSEGDNPSGTFSPAQAYQGSREGYVFKCGPLGLGYYRDGVSHRAPSLVPQPRLNVGAAGRRVRFAD